MEITFYNVVKLIVFYTISTALTREIICYKILIII